MVEGARLESVYTETYRGFESLSLRQAEVLYILPTPQYSSLIRLEGFGPDKRVRQNQA